MPLLQLEERKNPAIRRICYLLWVGRRAAIKIPMVGKHFRTHCITGSDQQNGENDSNAGEAPTPYYVFFSRICSSPEMPIQPASCTNGHYCECNANDRN